MILTDTSVWSLVLRRNRVDLNEREVRIHKALSGLVAMGGVQLLGVVRQELLSGIRERSQYERIRKQLRSFQDVSLDVEDYEEAARMNNVCRAAGVTGSPIDYLLCACAVRRGWEIFAEDRDFIRYARHLPIALFTIR